MVNVMNPTLHHILRQCENTPIYAIPSTYLSYIQLELRKMGIQESLKDVEVIRMATIPIEGHPLVALLPCLGTIPSYYCFYPTEFKARRISAETRAKRKHGYLSI